MQEELVGFEVQTDDPAAVQGEQRGRDGEASDQRHVRDLEPQHREVHRERGLAHARHPGQHDVRAAPVFGVLPVVDAHGELDGRHALVVRAVEVLVQPGAPHRLLAEHVLKAREQRAREVYVGDAPGLGRPDERVPDGRDHERVHEGGADLSGSSDGGQSLLGVPDVGGLLDVDARIRELDEERLHQLLAAGSRPPGDDDERRRSVVRHGGMIAGARSGSL